MLPRFEIVGRQRPVAVVGVPFVEYDATPAEAVPSPHLAPCAAIEAGLASGSAAAELALHGADGSALRVRIDDGSVALSVTTGGSTTHHRSRRHGRTAAPPTRLGLALTGRTLAALTFEGGRWVVRGRVDLAERVPTHDVDWLAGLASAATSLPVGGAGGAGSTGRGVTDWRAGTFGQLGLRDVRLVTTADGAPYLQHGELLFTATSAGPGFFDTAHASVWRADPATLELRHSADLWFERPDRPGAYGDHAVHLVRDGERWLVAASTWADFPTGRRWRETAHVGVTLAESTGDLTRGQHRLTTRALDLPTEGRSVGVWDPHLARDGDAWLVGYVSARKFFDFHPVLASGPSLDDLSLRAAAVDRRATEGTTLARLDGAWRVLASDGRDNPRSIRRRYPVLDLDLQETGALTAPYPTNIPWPTLVPPLPGAPDWRLVTFDGQSYGGALVGYGTHGDVVTMRGVP